MQYIKDAWKILKTLLGWPGLGLDRGCLRHESGHRWGWSPEQPGQLPVHRQLESGRPRQRWEGWAAVKLSRLNYFLRVSHGTGEPRVFVDYHCAIAPTSWESNAAALASRWHHIIEFDRPEIIPQTTWSRCERWVCWQKRAIYRNLKPHFVENKSEKNKMTLNKRFWHRWLVCDWNKKQNLNYLIFWP